MSGEGDGEFPRTGPRSTFSSSTFNEFLIVLLSSYSSFSSMTEYAGRPPRSRSKESFLVLPIYGCMVGLLSLGMAVLSPAVSLSEMASTVADLPSLVMAVFDLGLLC